MKERDVELTKYTYLEISQEEKQFLEFLALCSTFDRAKHLRGCHT